LVPEAMKSVAMNCSPPSLAERSAQLVEIDSISERSERNNLIGNR
jgi:hypothetical protein